MEKYIEYTPDVENKIELLDLNSVKDCNSFTVELLSIEPRIKFYNTLELDDNFLIIDHYLKFFKTHIRMPGFYIPTLEHEIAHIVEMNDPSRWLLTDLGMKASTVSSMAMDKGRGIIYSAKKLVACSVREIRTRTIELYINGKEGGYLWNHNCWLDILELPFGKFKKRNDIRDWEESIRETTRKQWSADRVRHEWKIRMDHYKEFAETK